MTINVMLVENRMLVATGLRRILESEEDIRVLDMRTECHAPCQQDCMQPLPDEAVMPDVLIIDLALEGACSFDCIRRIVARQPSAHILALGENACSLSAQHALSLGATGYVCEQAAAEELLNAVRSVAAGNRYICPKAGRHLLSSPSFTGHGPFDSLTRREYQIMMLMLAGRSPGEISRTLSISYKTLSNHHTHILRKLEARNLVDLTRMAIRHGIIQAGVLASAALPEIIGFL